MKKVTPPPLPPIVPPPKKVPARRPSTSVPTIRRSETETARPKREIHPPPPKDLPYSDIPKKSRRATKVKRNDGTTEQLKFCGKILSDLHKRQYIPIASPFYYPVGKFACSLILMNYSDFTLKIMLLLNFPNTLKLSSSLWTFPQ